MQKNERALICVPFRWAPLWASHAMAPSPIMLADGRIRIYVGGWDENGISRIWWIDVDAENPTRMIGHAKRPVVDIGRPGAFDENGVFPGHATEHLGRVYLTTTGFQLGHLIRHYNFGGLTISDDGGETFHRASEAPVLDRADEGLHVRAGQSLLWDAGTLQCTYASGTGWVEVGGVMRPTYDVRHQVLERADRAGPEGEIIVKHDSSIEHALGRPQLLRHNGRLIVLYTRRTLDMQYCSGGAALENQAWIRHDSDFGILPSSSGFDNEMSYFPGALSWNGQLLVFYSGNGYGRSGLGVTLLDV